MMIEAIDIADIEGVQAPLASRVTDSLEAGQVVVFPHLSFTLGESFHELIDGDGIRRLKRNITYNPDICCLDRVEHGLDKEARRTLCLALGRFASFTETLLHAITPHYVPSMRRGRTSFRPLEIASHALPWRADDRLRHVDAASAAPTGGARMLRIFMNIDPAGRDRHWRIGPNFENYASRFLPRATAITPGAASLMAAFGMTKSRRTGYDQLMLNLHDAGKRDRSWQLSAPAEDLSFAPGNIWMLFTDQVPHAALSGCNALEQTFYVDPAVLLAPDQSPLAILSRLTGRDLRRPLV